MARRSPRVDGCPLQDDRCQESPLFLLVPASPTRICKTISNRRVAGIRRLRRCMPARGEPEARRALERMRSLRRAILDDAGIDLWQARGRPRRGSRDFRSPGLPSYAWAHRVAFRRQARLSSSFRTRDRQRRLCQWIWRACRCRVGGRLSSPQEFGCRSRPRSSEVHDHPPSVHGGVAARTRAPCAGCLAVSEVARGDPGQT